ncbi:DNA-binding transcriptional regulator of sugar metabolism, DeoR/GlpR family [Robiginitalea myxolifaciens]|uniref:DNA-binding transcriptional regulator of sugar metabolism, DeoR/GlpR family n=1 Tax=Robiginitalea myxolifaciens TaxID=400055 RepID=A0A1I6FN56_9FLAO|nr:DeoR/GlpR family DNA-binding transcription regulator [Robiginitalea myxolifaciens]SFR31382.1 DNA-binding transcriptional regulator of sugar metabolism, DeoR/GlpR family [Robiginitalea myxolifaciens]
MLKEERQRIILGEVDLHNRIQLTDMAEMLDVSIDTVRRDVKELDALQKLQKVHGGAVSLGFVAPTSPANHTYALDEKRQIAAKAVGLLKDGGVIFIDGGTTCLELARQIPEKLSLTCFTLSLPVALQLLSKPRVRVIMIGGEISREAQIATGANAVHALGDIRVDYGFIGTGYVDALHGLTEFDWEVVQVKKSVIAASRKAVLLCISEKLNSQHRYRTCDISAINTLITELEPENNRLNPFRSREIHLL